MENTHPAKRQRIGERTLLACTGCKQRKLKCDGQSPKCQNCIKSNRECLVEDPATGLHRPRDYMQTLESHVAHLESLLQQTRPDIAGDHLNPHVIPPDHDPVVGSVDPWLIYGNRPLASSALSQAAHPTNTVEAQTSPATQSGTDSHVDDLSSDVALLCISAAGREPHYFGPSSAVSFSRIASQAMGIRASHGRAQSLSNKSSSRNRNHRAAKPSLPSQAQAGIYVSAYFVNIHPQYPLLHEPTFQRWQDECRQMYETDGDITRAGNIPTFFAFMVYAIGCLTLGPSYYDAAEDFYAVALDRITPILDLDSLESIQSILCCAVYSIRSPLGASLWKVSGMAIRHCVELGYHRSARRFRRHADTLTREMSSRCFWVAYDIDRVAANVLGRPDGISDHFIDAEYPLDIDDKNITSQALLQEPRTSATTPPTSLSGAIHVIKLRRLWSKFGTHLYQFLSDRHHSRLQMQGTTIHALRQELDEWLACAPTISETPPSQPRSTFASHKWFRLAYCHSILLLYRSLIMEAHIPSAQSFDACADPQLSNAAFSECHNAAKEICVLYRRLFQSPTIQLTWGGLHILFMAALTYLYCLWRSETVRKSARTSDVVRTCSACTMVLVTIAERWPSASTYRDIFETLSERTIDMICGDQTTSSSHVSAEQTQFAPPEQQNSFSQTHLDMPEWLHETPDVGLPGSQSLLQELMQGIGEPSGFSGGSTTLLDEQDFGLGADWQGYTG